MWNIALTLVTYGNMTRSQIYAAVIGVRISSIVTCMSVTIDEFCFGN
jgi:hypothetical protein